MSLSAKRESLNQKFRKKSETVKQNKQTCNRDPNKMNYTLAINNIYSDPTTNVNRLNTLVAQLC